MEFVFFVFLLGFCIGGLYGRCLVDAENDYKKHNQ